MKLVINRCYGGFGLSPKAVKRLAELQGKPCYLFTSAPGNIHKHIPLDLNRKNQKDRFLFFSAYTVPNPDEVGGSQEGWLSMSQEEREACNKRWEAISLETRPSNRADPLLIQVVEELGEEANGPCAELKIVEIPDGTQWEIDEYDGMERVDEVHNSWS